MGLRVVMAVGIISGLTTLLAPGTGRNDSSCRQILESVRRVCQSSLGADCRSSYVHTHMYMHMHPSASCLSFVHFRIWLCFLAFVDRCITFARN